MSRSTARTATRPVNEGKDLNSGKSTKDEPSSKGHQGESSLRKAEVAQLQSFVRARAKQVDSEINELREKLKSSNVKTTPSTLRLTQSVDNPLQRSAAQNNLVVSGKSLGTVDLQPSEVLQRSKIATSALEHKADALRFSSNLGNERNDTNHLSTILAKMRLCTCCISLDSFLILCLTLLLCCSCRRSCSISIRAQGTYASFRFNGIRRALYSH